MQGSQNHRTPDPRWLLCLWPGLAELWRKGHWPALGWAVLFAAALNLLVLGSFHWSELLGASVRNVGWAALAVAWSTSAWLSARRLRELDREPATATTADLFPQAQAEYLRGNWFEAESILERQLAAHHTDVEARLLLATLFRHTRRPEEARQQLDRLRRLEAAAPWQWEIENELKQLDQLLGERGTSVP